MIWAMELYKAPSNHCIQVGTGNSYEVYQAVRWDMMMKALTSISQLILNDEKRPLMCYCNHDIFLYGLIFRSFFFEDSQVELSSRVP